MKNKAIKTKLLTVLLALCMVLSLVPMTAFAADQTVIDRVDFNHETPSYRYGDTPRALASVTDSNANYKIYDEYLEECVLVEEREGAPDLVRPTGRYWHSNPLENAHLAADKKITKLEPGQGISYHYCVVLEPKSSSYKFTEDTVVNIPNGIPSTGTPKTHPYIRLVDMGIRLRYLYWASVPVIKTITDVSVVNVNTSLSDSTPVSFTAQPGASCADKFDITEEMWEAAQPLNDMIKNTDTPRAPIAGGNYWYSLVLTAKPGYEFSQDFSENGGIKEGSGVTFTVNGVSYTGRIAVSADGKTLTAWEFMDPVTPAGNTGVSAITSAAVENVKLDYKHGDAPQPSARRAGVNMDKYDILYESWGKREKTDEFTTETVAYWYSDESWYQAGEERLTAFDKDGQYQYSVRLKAKDGYTFNGISADDITLNGKSLPEGSDVIVLDEGRSCIVIYGMTLRTVRPLESVTLNGVSTEFYVDGDKPRFNGYSGSAFSDVAYEKWEDKDDRSVGINSDESLNGGYGKLIESFKHGKTYTYGVAFNIADLGLEQGYRFDENTKLYLHGKEVTLNPQQVQVTDGGMTIRFTDVFSMTPEAPWQKIDLVEIEGATVNFKAGDKPVFTGKVPESSPNVLRQCEFWDGSDGSGVNSYWFWDQNYEKHITAFESGKTYTYGVYVKAAHGYYFTRDTKLKINGKFYNYHLPEGDPELDNPDFMATLWAVTNLTITPEGGSAPHSHSYGAAWKYDGTNHWHECACGDKADTAAHTFKWVTDKEATAAEKGSKHEECTVCGYKKAAVDIPATGSGNGSADQPNKPGNTSSPQTGDNSSFALWFAVLFISGGVLTVLGIANKKKKVGITK